MDVTELQNNHKLSKPTSADDLRPNLPNCGIRNGVCEENWRKEQYQKYKGVCYQDCLHAFGTYEWGEKEKYIYEGKLYANNLEGYGVFSYPDGSVFEGLFKYNQRYGPGVFTYPDGTQDVGLWTGLNLVKLSLDATSKHVPSLSKSIQAKVYLMQFKELVPVSTKPKTVAEETLITLNANENFPSNKLCNTFIRNPQSLFFDHTHFDNLYFSDEIPTVDVIVSFENGDAHSKEMEVTDLLAWNNEEDSVSFLKHTFKHRRNEHILSFDVNQIIIGARQHFNKAGVLESMNKEFLVACCEGDQKKIANLITGYDLNPDVSDILGNCGVHCVASNSHLLALRTLTNFGANLDRLNDEGLTPFIICLLRYIQFKYIILDWEKAFLPQLILKTELQQWRPYMCLDNRHDVEDQLYILDIKCRIPIPEKQSKSKKKKGKGKPKLEKRIKGRRKTEGSSGQTESDMLAERLERERLEREDTMHEIYKTAILLLHYGADPNYGQIPFPPLILSIFTKSESLVEQILKYGGDSNIRTSKQDGGLTPLHILASLPPSPETPNLAELLIHFGANVNIRANDQHWIEEKEKILGGVLMEEDDLGKNPLHLLCMRYDFVQDHEDILGCLLEVMLRGTYVHNMFYLGHNYLTLAMLRGNCRLMEQILNTGLFDTNQPLGNKMGVALTIPVLKRYAGFLPVDTCKKVYSVLNKYNANPFNAIYGEWANALEFCEEENEEVIQRKKKAKSKPNHNILFLNKYAHGFLERHIQGQIVKLLYEYKIECDIVDPTFDKMATFLTVEETINILQLFVNNDVIKPSRGAMYDLLKYIETVSFENKTSKSLQTSKTMSSIKSAFRLTEPSVKWSDKKLCLEEMIRKFKKGRPLRYLPAPPEFDPQEKKYKVCFHCLQKTGKNLVLCPICQSVYFCSMHCNKLNVKLNTRHKCKDIFYDTELARQKEPGEDIEEKQKKWQLIRKEYLKDPGHDFDLKYGFKTFETESIRRADGKRKSEDDLQIDAKKRRGKSPTSDLEYDSEIKDKSERKKRKGSPNPEDQLERKKKAKKGKKSDGTDNEDESKGKKRGKAKKKSKKGTSRDSDSSKGRKGKDKSRRKDIDKDKGSRGRSRSKGLSDKDKGSRSRSRSKGSSDKDKRSRGKSRSKGLRDKDKKSRGRSRSKGSSDRDKKSRDTSRSKGSSDRDKKSRSRFRSKGSSDTDKSSRTRSRSRGMVDKDKGRGRSKTKDLKAKSKERSKEGKRKDSDRESRRKAISKDRLQGKEGDKDERGGRNAKDRSHEKPSPLDQQKSTIDGVVKEPDDYDRGVPKDKREPRNIFADLIASGITGLVELLRIPPYMLPLCVIINGQLFCRSANSKYVNCKPNYSYM